MKTINNKTLTFDSTEVMRKIRDEISLEIMNMSYTEEKDHIAKLLAEKRNNEPLNDKTMLSK